MPERWQDVMGVPLGHVVFDDGTVIAQTIPGARSEDSLFLRNADDAGVAVQISQLEQALDRVDEEVEFERDSYTAVYNGNTLKLVNANNTLEIEGPEHFIETARDNL